MTPEKFFLKYAFPCSDAKLQAEKITIDDFERLTRFALGGGSPDRALLIRSYPDAYKDACALADKVENVVWDINHMKFYWRHHHRGPSPVERLYFRSMNGLFAVLSRNIGDYKDFVHAMNLYDLDLKEGNLVYTHQRCVIEKIGKK